MTILSALVAVFLTDGTDAVHNCLNAIGAIVVIMSVLTTLITPFIPVIAIVVIIGAIVVVMSILTALIAVEHAFFPLRAGIVIMPQLTAIVASINFPVHTCRNTRGTFIISVSEGQAVFAIVRILHAHRGNTCCRNHIAVGDQREGIRLSFSDRIGDLHIYIVCITAEHTHAVRSLKSILCSEHIVGPPCHILHHFDFEHTVSPIGDTFHTGQDHRVISLRQHRAAQQQRNDQKHTEHFFHVHFLLYFLFT